MSTVPNRSIENQAVLEEERQIYDTGMERALLSVLMKDPMLIHEVRSKLTRHDFYNVFNRAIYEAMLYFVDRQSLSGGTLCFDIPSMLSMAEKVGKLDSFKEKVGGMEYLNNIYISPSDTKSFSVYMEAILNCSARVKFYRKGRQVQQEALKNSTETRNMFVGRIEREIDELIAGEQTGEIIHLGKSARDFLKTCELNRGRNKVGVEVSMMPRLMKLLNGFRRKQFIILFARPKTGKSAFFLNVGIDVAGLQGIPVLYIDTEMSADEQQSRIISKWSNVNEWDIENGRYIESEDKKRAVNEVVNLFENSPFFYLPAKSMPVDEVIAQCRTFRDRHVGFEDFGGKERTKPCLIIYDWLKIAEKDSLQNVKEYQELGFIATKINNMSKALDLPVLVGAQANRFGADKAVGVQSASHAQQFLADSDRLLRFCTCLMWLRRLNFDEMKIASMLKPEHFFNQMIHVVDQRKGPVSMEGICLNYKGERLAYQEMDYVDLANPEPDKLKSAELASEARKIAKKKDGDDDELFKDSGVQYG